MKLRIDKETDALYLRLDNAKVIESEQVGPGVVVDFDAKNRVVGVEVLNVSQRISKRKRPASPVLVKEKPAKYGR